jgi:transposase
MRAATAVCGTARCPTTCHRSRDPSAKQRSAEPSEGAHRRYADWSAERFARQARDIGPETEALILAVLARRPHPEQGFRTCIGVLRLFRGLDAARVEAISHRAVEVGVLTYASVASIIKHRLDQSASPQAADGTPLLHENIRGSGYFH